MTQPDDASPPNDTGDKYAQVKDSTGTPPLADTPRGSNGLTKVVLPGKQVGPLHPFTADVPHAPPEEPMPDEATILNVVEPEAFVPEAVVPEAVVPEAVVPEAIVPEAVVPEAVVPEAVVPEAVVDERPQATQPPVPAKKLPILMIGVLPLALIIILGVGAWLVSHPVTSAVPTPVASPISTITQVAATAIPPSVSPSVPVNTVTITETYAMGIAAMTKSNWPLAVEHLQAVYNQNPDYLDVRDQLSGASLQWGTMLMQQGDIALALAQMRNSATIKPSETTSALVNQLDLYQTARTAIDNKDWAAAIDALTKLRKIDPEFLNSADLLYTAYMGQSGTLEKNGQHKEALQACKEAQALKPGDQAAKNCISDLATPTPLPPVIFSTHVFDQPTDAAVHCGDKIYESRIWGVVTNQSGKGIRGATVQVQSADHKNTYKRTTNNQGGFEVGGLGCTTWNVRLTFVPSDAKELRADSVSVDLNGGRFSGAGVEFHQK